MFWLSAPPPESAWLDELRAATEADGVRVLEHFSPRAGVSQFLISTRPETAPPAAVRSIKGRLQHLVRKRLPKAFHRNYGLRSLGSVNCDTVRQYIEAQTAHHRMADARVQAGIEELEIRGEYDRLTAPRTSAHAQYCYNLHVVLVSCRRDVEIRGNVLKRRRSMIVAAADKKGHLMGNGQILADHIHLALGCGLDEAPGDVAMSYLNNLAFAEGMRPVYEFGFYVGTFGEYDLGAISQRQEARCDIG
ncbi:MAG TPA: transposase [Pirellulales bacterium]|nr:transposase [Pirellulales bacterium]